MRRFRKEENGNAIVEATILLPFCTIVVIALFYASLFMCQKVNLQTNVQNALLYYKNVDSDTNVIAKANMDYSSSDGTIGGVGSSYGGAGYFFPYRFLGMKFNSSELESFFRSMSKHMFFDDGSNVTFQTKKTNYIVYKTISATATQTITPAVSLEMVGGPKNITISAKGTVVINNGDDFVRNTDFAVDIFRRSELGKKATELVEKAVDYYGKFKEKFGI